MDIFLCHSLEWALSRPPHAKPYHSLALRVPRGPTHIHYNCLGLLLIRVQIIDINVILFQILDSLIVLL
jgi:hypothetical protein